MNGETFKIGDREYYYDPVVRYVLHLRSDILRNPAELWRIAQKGGVESRVERICEKLKNVLSDSKYADGVNQFNSANQEMKNSNYNAAMEHLSLALQFFQEKQVLEIEAEIYFQMGVCTFNSYKYEEAIGYFNKALELHRKLRDASSEGRDAICLGITYHNLGDYNRTIACFKNAQKIYRRIRDESGEAAAYTNLGDAYSEIYDYEKAVVCFNKALGIYEKLKDLHGMADIWHSLSYVYFGLGRGLRAFEFVDRSLALHELLHDEMAVLADLFLLGNIYYAFPIELRTRDNNREAADVFDGIVRWHEHKPFELQEKGDIIGEAYEWYTCGKAYYCLQCSIFGYVGDYLDANGDPPDHKGNAIWCFEKALKIYEQINNLIGMINVYDYLGRIYLDFVQGGKEKGIEYINKALEISKQIKAQTCTAQLYISLGFQYQKKIEKAIECFNRAIEIYEKTKNLCGVAKCYIFIGDTYDSYSMETACESPKKAIENALAYYNMALKISERINSLYCKKIAYLRIMSTYKSLGQERVARPYADKVMEICHHLFVSIP